MKKILLIVAFLACVIMFTSCSKNDDTVVTFPEQPVVLNCVKPDYLKPDYLKPGDKVALISPSYFTPMGNVEKTADVTALATPMIVQPSEIPQE